MRKRAKKLLALLTAVTVTVTGVNVPAAQAAKPKATASKTTLYYNGTSAEQKATVTVKNVKGKKVTYSISKADKKIVTLGKVSGKKSNKTKKFTVTAKKAGKATVIVKVAGKKVKTIKFTVKKKSTDTPKPSVAPSQAPSDAPSVEPTVAPSDAPSVEPTVAPSDAPSVEPTVAPTETPKDKSVVTEIKILNETALTNAAGTKAYVYYDVLDQYGESMRESASITWTTSPAGGRASKSTGKITIDAETGKKFTYGDQLYVVGVEPKTGVSISQSVKVGLAQQLDTISFEGFVKASDKKTKLETIGTDFATGADPYYLIYKSYDQNGNELDYDPSLAASVLFTADAPMLLKLEADPAVPSVSIGEDTYSAIKVVPQLYADKGGEVNITAISNKTGSKVVKNYVIGDAGVLGSFEILEPKSMVTDGDQGVEIPFEAKDTAGNTITNYETIVRSTNTLSLTAGDTTSLKLSEKNDGTAKLVWSDKTDANRCGTYMTSDAWDGVARPVSLTAVVVGGKGSTLMLSVEDARIPEKVSMENITLADKETATLATQSVWWNQGSSWSFIDQYGDALGYTRAASFIYAANTNGFGSDGANYKLRMRFVNAQDAISAIDGNATALSGASNPAEVDHDLTAVPREGSENWSAGNALGGFDCTLTAATNGDVKTGTIKASIIKIDPNTGDTDNVAKASTSTFTSVPTTKLKAFAIDGICTTYRLDARQASFPGIDTATTTVAKGNIANVAGVAVIADTVDAIGGAGLQLSVKGTYKGQKLNVNGYYLDWSVNTKVDMTASGAIAGIMASAVKAKDAYDLEAYGDPAKTFDLDVSVEVTGATTETISKAASFSLAEQKATELKFAIDQSNPTNTAISSVIKDCYVLDQFGHRMTGVDVVYTVENIIESTSNLTHVKDSITVSNSGATDPTTISINGLEIGDEYDVVGTIRGTKITCAKTATIGADNKAYIDQNGDSDEVNLRKNYLNYTR